MSTTIRYEIYTSTGFTYGVVSVTGEDEEDCQQQIDQYLDTKQNCSASEGEPFTPIDSDEE